MKKVSKYLTNHLEWLIVGATALVCVLFIVFGTPSDNGSITLDGKDAKIEEYTKDFIEDANAALSRLMNKDKPTDEQTIEENEGTGQGFYTTIDDILGRKLADGNHDGGKGWQCSRYTGWLATGKWSYSSSHPDYGPVNGKDVAAWLVKNYGFKYIDQPVKGAIGSGGFNTAYGHTAMFMYSTGTNTAMVNDANYVPLTVNTHNMNIAGWVWVVPGNYEPKPAPTPEPAPTPSPEPLPLASEVRYTYVAGDTFASVIRKLGLESGSGLWGANGDVRYYTAQLEAQGIVVDRNGRFYGNIPVGKEIILNRR